MVVAIGVAAVAVADVGASLHCPPARSALFMECPRGL